MLEKLYFSWTTADHHYSIIIYIKQLQTIIDISAHGIGFVYRGGVSGTSSEPPVDTFTGTSCQDLCQRVWHSYAKKDSRFLTYARCTAHTLGNNEVVADILLDSTIQLLEAFMKSCTRMRLRIIRIIRIIREKWVGARTWKGFGK